MGDCTRGYHVMAKPVGAACNLRCDYCFYLEKADLLPPQAEHHMSEQVLETYIKDYITGQKIPEISFVWQGGEPMLAGLDFYEKVIRLQKKYGGGKTIKNSLQTNGVLLDDAWCRFLKKHDFLVGVSLDGHKEINDLHRRDAKGGSVFADTMNGIGLLQSYGIAYNVLACVSKGASAQPLAIYRFFREQGIQHIQFTPVVERIPADTAPMGLRHAQPDSPGEAVTDWSVPQEAYGNFLNAIFDEWVQRDVGTMFVMNFEWALTAWLGLESTLCLFAKTCGGSAIIEQNGDIYSCDHFVYPQYRLGNISDTTLADLMSSQAQAAFGQKKETLPRKCQLCDALFACRGECPRHRFCTTSSGEQGLSYLCKDYRSYYRHIHPHMKAMAQLIQNGCAASEVMHLKERPILIFNK